VKGELLAAAPAYQSGATADRDEFPSLGDGEAPAVTLYLEFQQVYPTEGVAENAADPLFKAKFHRSLTSQ